MSSHPEPADALPRWKGMLVPWDGGRRMPALDGLRGLMALAVAAYHLSVWTGLFPSGHPWNMRFALMGNYGVSAFFLLSGFVLFRTYTWDRIRSEGFGRFYFRRWLRLAPLFYATVLLNLVLGLGMGPAPSLRMVAENLTLTFGAIHPNHALVVGGWCVGLEALFYAAFPALAWVSARAGWLGLFALLALGVGLSLPYTQHAVMAAPLGERFHLYVQPENQVFLFLVGGLMAYLHAKVTWRLAPWVAVPLALGFLLLLVRVDPPFYDHLAALTGLKRYLSLSWVALMILTVSLSAGQPGPVGRVLAYLGAWSYAAYLLHPFLHRAVMLAFTGWSAFGLSLLGTFVLAALAERWVERPLAHLGTPKNR